MQFNLRSNVVRFRKHLHAGQKNIDCIRGEVDQTVNSLFGVLKNTAEGFITAWAPLPDTLPSGCETKWKVCRWVFRATSFFSLECHASVSGSEMYEPDVLHYCSDNPSRNASPKLVYLTYQALDLLIDHVMGLMAQNGALKAALQPILDAADWPLLRDGELSRDAQHIIAYLETELTLERGALERKESIGSIRAQRGERLHRQRAEHQTRITQLKRLLENIRNL